MNEGSSLGQQFSWTEQFTVNLSDLSNQIHTSFSLEELNRLCFDLGINHEDLEGSTLPAKAQSLTEYCDRRGRLPDLVNALKLARPNVSWAEATIAGPDQGNSTAQERDSQANASQDSSHRDIRSFWIGAIAGAIVISALSLALYFFVFEQPPGLDRYLTPVKAYSFNNTDEPLEVRKAQPEFVTGLSFSDTNQPDRSLEVGLNLPESAWGEAISSFAGGICAPIDKENPIDAVSAIVRAPRGINTLAAIFYASDGDEYFFSGTTQLEQDKWTPVFWGTKFGHSGDGWNDWDGLGAKEICLWVASDKPFEGTVQIDDLIIHQKKLIVD